MFVSNVPERDVLYVYERGYVDDGLEPERKLELCGHVSLMLSIDGKECVGFIFGGLSEFDFEAPENAAVWSGPRFDVPAFGIEQGTIGLIGATARMVLGTLRTPDRVLFDAAVSAPDPASALPLWEECLAEGNELARYALGYTLLALDRPREAHEQLKRYSALVRRNAWAWCYLGQACERLQDWEGAEYAYRQALEATASGSFDTDAAELLAGLLARLASQQDRSAADASRYGEQMNDDRETEAGPSTLGERFEQALQFAAATHRLQRRKGSDVPYIGHLLGVCSLVIEDGGDEDEAIAALLHDAAEDQGGETMLVEISQRFGPRVADIVAACSDTLKEPKPEWRERKETYLEPSRASASFRPARVGGRQAVQRASDPPRLPAGGRRVVEPVPDRPGRTALVLPRARRPLQPASARPNGRRARRGRRRARAGHRRAGWPGIPVTMWIVTPRGFYSAVAKPD